MSLKLSNEPRSYFYYDDYWGIKSSQAPGFETRRPEQIIIPQFYLPFQQTYNPLNYQIPSPPYRGVYYQGVYYYQPHSTRNSP